MLTCFDLKPKHSITEFQKSLTDYTAHMHELDLVESHSPIGLRQSDTILDTDDERKQKYFMIMQFRDREQYDKAVAYIKNFEEPAKSLHTNAYSKTKKLTYISWEDIE